MRKRWYLFAPLAILGFAAFILLGGEVVMRLWNWLLPPLFGWGQIGFWQALGLLALCRILFGGFGHHGRGGRPGRGWKDRCSRMSPEEREKFRKAMQERWEFGAAEKG